MSTNDKLAQALREMMDSTYNYGFPHDHPARKQAREALAAHEAEKAAPVAVPLTDEEKLKMWRDFDHPWGFGKYEWYLQGVEDAERILAKRWGVKLEGGE